MCIDGKTLCGSRGGGRKAVHMVSAWVNANSLTLGQLETCEKSNEITAKIRSKGADYVLAVKGNHPTLHEEIAEYFRHLVPPASRGHMGKRS